MLRRLRLLRSRRHPILPCRRTSGCSASSSSPSSDACCARRPLALLAAADAAGAGKPPFSAYAFSRILSSPHSPEQLRQLLCLLFVHGFMASGVLAGLMARLYASLGYVEDALQVFGRMPHRNVFAWNSLLKGFLDAEMFEGALRLYNDMVRGDGVVPDSFTYPLVAKACVRLSDLEWARRIWRDAEEGAGSDGIKQNVFVQCAFIDMFAKCGSLVEARSVFERMQTRDLATWGAIVGGTVRDGYLYEALSLFIRMRRECFIMDYMIASTVISVCSKTEELHLGLGMHGSSVRSGISDNLAVSNALVDMYCKLHNLEAATLVFQSIETKDIVSWSSIVVGYSQNGKCIEGLSVCSEMIACGVQPNSITIAGLLPGLSEMKLLQRGKEIHACAMRRGIDGDKFVASALIDLYCKSGSARTAELIFNSQSDQDIVVTNSYIAGVAQLGDVHSALSALRRQQEIGFRPDYVTLVSILPVCNLFSMLRQGKELHAYAIKKELNTIIPVSNSLIDMYCKCGCLELGGEVFCSMPKRDVVTYNTIIAAYGMHGHGARAIQFFNQMKEDRISPNKVTFVALLSSCSHSGLVDIGLSLYDAMAREYGLSPETKHFSCIVDLYSRAGRLDEAWDFITNATVHPEIDVLGSLLECCRAQKRPDIAELVCERIFKQEPDDPGYHIVLSNIYAETGRWDDSARVRAAARRIGLVKNPANSWA